ncbi:MAG TPA: head GIN domain-containing protein [Bacteroidia bacterium]|nr:head GIN domain-containing protein [Bacteroidia bacterium]
MIEVQGNGNIVSREVSVSSFIRLHLSGKGMIELHQSDEEKVIIETDENLHEYFSVENSGRTLFVTAEGKFRKPVYTVCTIKVFLRQLDVLYIRNDRADVVCPGVLTLTSPLEIKIQSVGNTTLNINAPSIKVLSQCEGNVTLKGKCNLLEIKNQSQGDFDSKELIVEELVLKNYAEGNVKLFANKTIAISHYGQGTVHYSGDAQLKDVKQYGDGEIRHVAL